MPNWVPLCGYVGIRGTVLLVRWQACWADVPVCRDDDSVVFARGVCLTSFCVRLFYGCAKSAHEGI